MADGSLQGLDGLAPLVDFPLQLVAQALQVLAARLDLGLELGTVRTLRNLKHALKTTVRTLAEDAGTFRKRRRRAAVPDGDE